MNIKSYTILTFSCLNRELMASENNTDSYRAPPLSVQQTSSALESNAEFYYT
jgi:hypothetical protein